MPSAMKCVIVVTEGKGEKEEQNFTGCLYWPYGRFTTIFLRDFPGASCYFLRLWLHNDRQYFCFHSFGM